MLWSACQVWLFARVCRCKTSQVLGCGVVGVRDTLEILVLCRYLGHEVVWVCKG